MPINPKQHLVLIKGDDKTEDILEVIQESKCTVVTFKKEKSYSYSSSNVQWLSNPESIPIQNCRLSIRGSLLSDVKVALRFGEWVKIFHGVGGSRCCPFSSLSVQQMEAPDGRSKDVLAYFRVLAEGASLRTSDDDSLLAKKYRHLNSVSKDSILCKLSHCASVKFPYSSPC